LTIHLVYDGETGTGFDPVVVEFEARWNEDAKKRAQDLLAAYPDWEYWRLQRYDLEDVQSGFHKL
jgi:hypothetical protein